MPIRLIVIDMKEIVIFTDGASRGNPGPGGWGVILSDGEKLIELGGRENNTTNNRMEMQGVIEALSYSESKGYKNLKIYTDSAYVINGASKWLSGWENNNWQTKTKEPVKNADLWKKISRLINSFDIEWMQVSGHSGIPANERVDVIATSYADKTPEKLFSGLASDYDIDLTDVEVSKEKKYKKTNSKQKAYSYVSLVDGKIMTHKTWSECEARIKGVSKAKFKKAISKYEEEEIIKEYEN